MIDRRLLALLTCPRAGCGGGLRATRGGAVLTCRACPALYPVLDGIPIVVPEPHAYLASYRDPVLATLAEHGLASPTAVALVAAFADAAGPTEPLAFGDDWTRDETARPTAATDDDAIRAWLATAADPRAALAAAVPATATRVLEVGCGANQLAAALVRRGRVVVATARSLRAVARTRAAVPGVLGAVVEAEALPFAPGRFDAVVAANLVDLLDEPDRFLAAAAQLLGRAGRLVVSSPAPDLGTGDDDHLGARLVAAGLAVVAHRRGQPWLRAHTARHFQLYFADLVVGARGAAPVRPSRRGRVRGRDRDRGRGRCPARARGRARPPSS